MLKAEKQPPDVLVKDDRGAIRILMLNRPNKMNALNTPLTQALHDALIEADQIEGVRAVVLAGAGRSFCAGADLSEFKTFSADKNKLIQQRADLTCQTHMLLQRISKPIVSAVQGAAIGGGAGLAIGCDMMVAGTDLKFGYPELKHSIVPALVMTSLQRQLGRKRAFELISMGEFIGADEVYKLGLANRVVDPADVLNTAIEIASRWAEALPVAMATMKSLFYRVGDLPYDAAMAASRDVNIQMRNFRDNAA